MDALAHRMEEVFRPTAPRAAPAAWHRQLVAAVLGNSGGVGGAAVDAQGNKVVLEERRRRYGDCFDLLVRRFDRHGGERDATPIVVARRIADGTELNARVGLGPEGHFVVAWQDPAGWGIVARRYAPIGAALGPAFPVNSSLSLVPRLNPLVAVNAAGAFIVLWEHAWTSIRARLFGPGALPLGEEVDVCLTGHLRP